MTTQALRAIGLDSRFAWVLPAAGLLLGAPWILPLFASPADAAVEIRSSIRYTANDLDTWARIATSDRYQLFSLTQVLGIVGLLFGLLALHGYLARGRSPRWALAALILTVIGLVPELMMLGELAQAAPILATFYRNGINVCPSSLSEPGFIERWGILPNAFCKWWWGPMSFPMALALSFVVWPGSALTLAIAIWRSGLVSRWVGLPFGLAYFLCVWISPVVTLIGGFLLAVTGGWIALQLNRRSRGPGSSQGVGAAATAAPASEG